MYKLQVPYLFVESVRQLLVSRWLAQFCSFAFRTDPSLEVDDVSKTFRRFQRRCRHRWRRQRRQRRQPRRRRQRRHLQEFPCFVKNYFCQKFRLASPITEKSSFAITWVLVFRVVVEWARARARARARSPVLDLPGSWLQKLKVGLNWDKLVNK